MASDELRDFESKLQEQGKMLFPDAATEEQIAKFESDHGIVLPQKYKEWLLIHDGGEFYLPAGVQMYGVAHKPFIDVNDNDRPSDNYIVIGALATGDPILCEKASAKISIYNHEDNRIESDEVFPDFYAFLAALYEFLGIGD